MYGKIWPEPLGFPSGSGHILPYIPPLVLIRIQYNTRQESLFRTKISFDKSEETTEIQKLYPKTAVFHGSPCSVVSPSWHLLDLPQLKQHQKVTIGILIQTRKIAALRLAFF